MHFSMFAPAEILDFSYRSGIHFSHIIHSTSSAGTQAGLVVGQCISHYDTEIIGISASLTSSAQSERVRELAWSTAHMNGTSIDQAKIIVDDSFVGPGYVQASKEGEQANKLFARMEGILLDPVYTGKAAAALLDYSKSGSLVNCNVLFIHTGGNAGVYYCGIKRRGEPLPSVDRVFLPLSIRFMNRRLEQIKQDRSKREISQCCKK